MTNLLKKCLPALAIGLTTLVAGCDTGVESPDQEISGSTDGTVAPTPPNPEVPPTAPADDLETDPGLGERTGSAIDRGLDRASSTLDHGMRETGDALDRGLDKTGDVLNRGAEATNDAARRTGDALKRGAEATGDAARRAGDAVREAVDPEEVTGEKPADGRNR